MNEIGTGQRPDEWVSQLQPSTEGNFDSLEHVSATSSETSSAQPEQGAEELEADATGTNGAGRESCPNLSSMGMHPYSAGRPPWTGPGSDADGAWSQPGSEADASHARLGADVDGASPDASAPLPPLAHANASAPLVEQGMRVGYTNGSVQYYVKDHAKGTERLLRELFVDGSMQHYEGEQGAERLVFMQFTDGSLLTYSGSQGRERGVRLEYPDGSIAHFDGEKGIERLVRKKFPDGSMQHYEGSKGFERAVRAEYVDGAVHHYVGDKGVERLVRIEYAPQHPLYSDGVVQIAAAKAVQLMGQPLMGQPLGAASLPHMAPPVGAPLVDLHARSPAAHAAGKQKAGQPRLGVSGRLSGRSYACGKCGFKPKAGHVCTAKQQRDQEPSMGRPNPLNLPSGFPF
eukprot:CAMPEP_0183355100 /NCGR_PEP_ID=MMETSP0164_2-20130417/39160_1 /TAXON_ID=221442 /ORGANISM="Coccolithus pelagicus ssp braarudi, Strain PLY182g" /LENGTH=401 /DNA_ID=CAMNT_0025528117 /DNA_START=20 /DNA_END=1225 /DNA_ORIENTATION=-